jgi:anti-sigma B factor antagonist
MTQLATLSLERIETTAVAVVSGEIDFSNAQDLGARILQWVSNEDAALILDLTKLSYTDSAGINLVFDVAGRLREHGQAFRIVLPVDSQPWRTFSIVGVETQIPIFETIEQAQAGGDAEPGPSPPP